MIYAIELNRPPHGDDALNLCVFAQAICCCAPVCQRSLAPFRVYTDCSADRGILGMQASSHCLDIPINGAHPSCNISLQPVNQRIQGNYDE